MAQQNPSADLKALQDLNAQFIRNYITQDVAAHDRLIHPDFVCIENSGKVVGREEYLHNWATDYSASGVETFGYEDEQIRIFGDVALVRARSVYTYRKDGVLQSGASVYTDTYIREKGEWRCVQAHMTPVR